MYICQASSAVIPSPVHPHWLSMQKIMVRPCTAQGLIYLRYLFPGLQSRAGDAADQNDLAPQQCPEVQEEESGTKRSKQKLRYLQVPAHQNPY